jgi:Transport and Golgi organisation 2
MCTVTFIPRNDGFYVAMNRDERVSRPSASPPAVFGQGLVKSIYPLDSEGGTWIAANDTGVAFTLLNWNDTKVLRQKARTRGSVIPALVTSDCSHSAESAVRRLDPDGILPFRLVGIFPAEERVIEWRWDQESIQRNTFSWTIRQWCSSSLSDAIATGTRKQVLEQKLGDCHAGSLTWLRQLHSWHDDGRPLFSHCVHREEIETVSYTELVCSGQGIECNYLACSPCNRDRKLHRVSLSPPFAGMQPDRGASLVVNNSRLPFVSPPIA